MGVSADAVWSGVVALLGAGLGATVSYLATRQAWRRSETTALLEELVNLHDVLWADVSYRDARIATSRLRYRLAYLGVPKDLIDGLISVAMEGWQKVNAERDRRPDR
jgi:hypothetical protein